MSNGKGDSPRNCHSQAFRDNYAAINWTIHQKRKQLQNSCRHFWSSPDELGYRECLWCGSARRMP